MYIVPSKSFSSNEECRDKNKSENSPDYLTLQCNNSTRRKPVP